MKQPRQRELKLRDLDTDVLAMLDELADRTRSARPGLRINVTDLARMLLLAAGKDPRLLRRIGLPAPDAT